MIDGADQIEYDDYACEFRAMPSQKLFDLTKDNKEAIVVSIREAWSKWENMSEPQRQVLINCLAWEKMQ